VNGRRGRFITLEGIEGVGKSTNLEFVANRLRRAGKAVMVTREPGGVPVAERIRELLLHTERGAMGTMTELLLMFAARAAHLDGLIRGQLQRGTWIVCDRFTDATYAYQGGGRGVPASAIDDLRRLVQGDFGPDLTFLLDAPWDVSVARRGVRSAPDRFEREDEEFFRRVRVAYLARASEEPQRIRVVDASRPLVQVQADIAAALDDFLQGES
jgi:dTMP kinase